MSNPSALYVCWTTLASREEAKRLAELVVESGHAACAQIDGPIESFYQWEGKVASDTEFRLWIKATRERLPQLQASVLAAHPYQTPQWICLPCEIVAEKYLKWAGEASNLRDFS